MQWPWILTIATIIVAALWKTERLKPILNLFQRRPVIVPVPVVPAGATPTVPATAATPPRKKTNWWKTGIGILLVAAGLVLAYFKWDAISDWVTRAATFDSLSYGAVAKWEWGDGRGLFVLALAFLLLFAATKLGKVWGPILGAIVAIMVLFMIVAPIGWGIESLTEQSSTAANQVPANPVPTLATTTAVGEVWLNQEYTIIAMDTRGETGPLQMCFVVYDGPNPEYTQQGATFKFRSANGNLERMRFKAVRGPDASVCPTTL